MAFCDVAMCAVLTKRYRLLSYFSMLWSPVLSINIYVSICKYIYRMFDMKCICTALDKTLSLLWCTLKETSRDSVRSKWWTIRSSITFITHVYMYIYKCVYRYYKSSFPPPHYLIWQMRNGNHFWTRLCYLYFCFTCRSVNFFTSYFLSALCFLCIVFGIYRNKLIYRYIFKFTFVQKFPLYYICTYFRLYSQKEFILISEIIYNFFIFLLIVFLLCSKRLC